MSHQNTTPFDGVLPSDYPGAYNLFLRARCIKKIEEISVIYIGARTQQVSCDRCYNQNLFDKNETIHLIQNIHEIGLETDLSITCGQCKRELVFKQPAINCGYCTDILI